MKPGYFWLLIPLAAWSGYQTARPTTGPENKAGTSLSSSPRAAEIRAWSARFEKATTADLEKELLALLANQDSPDWTDPLKLLCARWAELDPAGALAFFEANKVPTIARHHLLKEWALLDSDAAWATIPAGKEGGYERQAVTRMLLNEDQDTFMWWFRQVRGPMPDADPAWLLVAERHLSEFEEVANGLTAELAATGGRSNQYSGLFALIARVRALKDPEAACQWAQGLDSMVRDSALSSALYQWSETDPLAVWQHLRADGKIPDSTMRLIGKLVLTKLAKENPAQAIELIREAGIQADRTEAIEAVRSSFPHLVASGKLSPIEAYRLISSAKAQYSVLGLNTLPSLWRGLSGDQLAEAARAISTEPSADRLDDALGGIANEWLRQDPQAALAFISEISDPNLKARTYSGLFRATYGGHTDPRHQAELLAMIPEGDRAAAFSTYVFRYGERKVGEGYGGGNYSGPPLQGDLLAPLFEKLPPSDELNRSLKVISLDWGEQDPSAALAWAATLKDPTQRQTVYTSAFEGWAHHNPYAAADWLADQKESPDRDAAALPLVQNLAKTDAEAAWAWSNSIRASGQRLEARASALKAWAVQDPDAAQAAYRQISSGLSAAEVSKLSSCFTGS
ncbi:hypothetical protein OJ996_16785 [Luteolibacter sp. GHJ8]|uniref:HEAT repeat protein n=1 Tax=Luteolibacter rhizosphaerae TaxID=2989719 RepID=A0ABT3G7P1_9BACT|nr:hypothetical protein [Luteolibacter rhizosphaerae]MCW1915245.1 hypothetical protein [Luteolibacter rhizosphaerae]